MKQKLQYEIYQNMKYTLYCQYNFERLGMKNSGMCYYEDSAKTKKDAKRQMLAHYAEMHGGSDAIRHS